MNRMLSIKDELALVHGRDDFKDPGFTLSYRDEIIKKTLVNELFPRGFLATFSNPFSKETSRHALNLLPIEELKKAKTMQFFDDLTIASLSDHNFAQLYPEAEFQNMNLNALSDREFKSLFANPHHKERSRSSWHWFQLSN